MQKLMGGAALAALCAGTAYAGGVERSTQSADILFEEGTYLELGFGYVSPDVSGTQASAIPPFFAEGAPTGDIAGGYLAPSLAFKAALSDKLDFALILNRPIGADVNYGNPAYLYGGSTASIDSDALTLLARYKLPSNFSVFGGVRNEQASGKVALFNGYTMTTDTASDWGYVIGAAWEKPEIAARVALTYNSAIEHDFTASESFSADPTSFTTEVPQSLNLEFQTGIAADTLLFGSVRWADWTAFDITPTVYTTLVDPGGSLVAYDNDTVTYNLGLGRRFTETWSGAVTVGYEETQGGYVGNLGPTDGFTSVGLAASYTAGKITITGGARYIWIGDAETESPLIAGTTQGDFEDNTGVAYGIQIGYRF
ncbi:outer membrane protein transport protein [Actibacterium sp. D379-3]